MEALGSAVLTDQIAAESALTVVVSREEIAAALENGGSAELLLEVVRSGAGQAEEHSTIGVDWTKQELQTVLERADQSDRVALTFDRNELAEALTEVEAHGLREKALVFAVAATGVLGSGAGIAAAMPIHEAGGSAAVASAAATQLTDASSGGGYAAAPAATADVVTDASSGGGYTAAPATDEGDMLLTDASSGGGYTAPSDEPGGGSGFVLDAPSPTDAVIAGGIALAIAAAAFTTRRMRPARHV